MKTFLCSHLVTLRWDRREASANLEKISAFAASVNAEQALPLGERVAIHAGTTVLRGIVVRCHFDEVGYEIEFALETEWSPDVFIPDHLFDPDVLLAPRGL